MNILHYNPRRPRGYLRSYGGEGPDKESETLSCVHCQMFWEIEPGSGRERGWCWRCAGPLCGKRQCFERCLPWEKACEIIEARERLYQAARKAIGR